MGVKITHSRVKGDKPKGTFGVKKPHTGKSKNRNRKGKKILSSGHKIDDLKLRPKAKKETKYTKWFHEVHQPPCFVCGTKLGIEFHHVKKHSTDERIDSIGMPLCWEHHHGTEFSPHGTPVRFRERYPMRVQYKSAAKMYKRFEERL